VWDLISCGHAITPVLHCGVCGGGGHDSFVYDSFIHVGHTSFIHVGRDSFIHVGRDSFIHTLCVAVCCSVLQCVAVHVGRDSFIHVGRDSFIHTFET